MKKYYDKTEQYIFMNLALESSKDSGCVSRQVGCVIVTAKSNTLIAGYNDMPHEMGTCKEWEECRCFDPNRVPGKDLDKVYASHAEVKAIGSAARGGLALDGSAIFVTDLPCNECAKLIIESGIEQVFYLRDYPNSKAKWLFDESNVYCHQVGEISEMVEEK